MSLQTLITRICPYVESPTNECYCTKEGSQDILNAVQFCSNDFERCDIFKAQSSHRDEIVTDN